jgi:hypothetical protein
MGGLVPITGGEGEFTEVLHLWPRLIQEANAGDNSLVLRLGYGTGAAGWAKPARAAGWPHGRAG